jgi:glycosyltransferase involved in cell wall biosynthesis
MLYKLWLNFAKKCNARVSLINFETPNFFNEYSQRDPSLWEHWKYVSRYCDSIISISKISSEYAKKFFTDVPQHCQFQVCEPTINCRAADRVGSQQRRKQIFVISRFGDFSAHKGGDLLTNVIVPEMKGFCLILLGGKKMSSSLRITIEKKCNHLGIHLNLLDSISDEEKFTIIKSSKFTIFLSRFEGYGYPPVESLYCNTPCLASDLPVLREISGKGLIYLKNDDVSESKKSVAEWCRSEFQDSDLRKFVAHVCGLDNMEKKLLENFRQISNCCYCNKVGIPNTPIAICQLQIFIYFVSEKFTLKYIKEKLGISP